MFFLLLSLYFTFTWTLVSPRTESASSDSEIVYNWEPYGVSSNPRDFSGYLATHLARTQSPARSPASSRSLPTESIRTHRRSKHINRSGLKGTTKMSSYQPDMMPSVSLQMPLHVVTQPSPSDHHNAHNFVDDELEVEIGPSSGLQPTIRIQGNEMGNPVVEIEATPYGVKPLIQVSSGGPTVGSKKRGFYYRTTNGKKNMHHTSGRNESRSQSNKIQTSTGIRKKKLPLSVEANWSYGDEEGWIKNYPKCAGYAQSPINIHPNSLSDGTQTLNLLNSYNTPIVEAQIENNGHTVQMSFIRGQRPSLTGTSCYGDLYIFEQVHFHWGSKNSIGSEHAVLGQKFPLEMHFVHFNQKYGSLSQAADKPDGLVVLAVLFQISQEDNPRFSTLLNALSEVRCGGQKTRRLNEISLAALLPENREHFYRYTGSLTTPPCYESVNWIILKHGLLIGARQMKMFRDLKQADCVSPIGNNWRNIQRLNGRNVDRTVSYYLPVNFQA